MTVSAFNKRIGAARRKARYTYEEAAFAIRDYLLPAQWVTSTTLWRYEHNIDEQNADPVLLWAFAQAYEVPLEQLSVDAAEWMETVSHLGERPKRWTTKSAGHSLAAASSRG